MLYVGVDAHKATSQVTVMDSGGNVLRRKRIVSSQTAVRQALAGYDEPLKAVLEATAGHRCMTGWMKLQMR